MIVGMKKATILMQQKDTFSVLKKLRSLGVVHVQHLQPPAGRSIVSLQEDIAFIAEAIDVLYKNEPNELPCMGEAKEPLDWKFTAKHIIELHKRLDQLREYSQALTLAIADWQSWGDFDPATIESLAQKNIYIRLYKIPAQELKNIPEGAIVERISVEKATVFCAIISRDKIPIPFQELQLPKMSLAKMQGRLAHDRKAIEAVEGEIHKFVCVRLKLQEIKAALEKEMEFQEALYGMGREQTIAYGGGFVPVDSVETLLRAAKEEKWGILIEEPCAEDEVPTLIRNPRWIRLIEPVMGLLGIAPGYRELDVSFLFLVFFSIFFGILIGDAGYGLSYLLLALCFHRKKMNPRNRDIFSLLYVLSSCAILWGLLTGTFFGQEWLTRWNISPLLPALNDPRVMQTLCFLLGAVHLTIAHSWRACLKFPGLSMLSEAGWIGILWASYFLARTLILSAPLPAFVAPLVGCSIVLVIFFTEPNKNIFKAAGAGLLASTFGLSFMSAFTDVVSYVRLFAVGLAGVAIADTTNTMAASIGVGVVAVIAGILIRVVGHVLNIVLGPMSILVHGVRLNVLEFGLNHTGLTWSGRGYKPLKL